MKREFKIFLNCLLITVSLFTSNAFAGVNAWNITGPEGGMSKFAYYLPGRAGTALISNGSFIHRTTDNGVSWARVRQDDNNRCIAANPANPNRVLIAGQGMSVFISDDGGLTFSQGPAFAPIITGGVTLVFSTNGQVVYGGTAEGLTYRSTDAGANWTPTAGTMPTSAEPLNELVVAPNDQNTVYAGFDRATNSLFKTVNGGGVWTSLNFSSGTAHSIAVDPSNANVVIVASDSGLFRSINAGDNFLSVNGGRFAIVRFDPTTPGRVFAVTDAGTIMSSANSGQNWSTLSELNVTLVFGLSFDTTHAGRIMFASSEGVMVSDDAGVNWQKRNTGLFGGLFNNLVTHPSGSVFATGYQGPMGVFARGAGNAWSQRGFDSMQAVIGFAPKNYGVTAFAAAPNLVSTLFASRLQSIFKSIDGGTNWTKPSTEFDGDFVNTIAIDPTNALIVYAGTGTRGVLRSVNGGTTWFPRSNGLAFPSVYALVIDPNNPLIMYAGSFSATPMGVYKTIDGGANWTAVNAGMTNRHVFKIAIDPSNSSIVYASTDDGLFRSNNGGATWALKLPGLSEDVAIDPASPNIVISTPYINGPNGMGRSVDGGETWQTIPLSSSAVPIKAVFDPSTPSNIIASAQMYSLLEIQIAPDLELVGTTPVLAVDAGKQTVTLQITNRGIYTASTVKLLAAIPSGVTDATIQSSKGSCTLTGVNITCAIGVLTPTEAMTVVIALTPTTTTGQLTAAVSAYEPDSVATNNAITLSSERRSDLSLTTVGSASTVNTGGALNFTMTVSNAGPSQATGVKVAAVLPAYLRFDSASSTAATCTATGSMLNCDVNNLAANTTAEIRINTTSTAAGSSSVTATVTATSNDVVATNNSSSTLATVQTPVPPSSGGGGGGTMSSWLLALLALFGMRSGMNRSRMT